MSTKTWFVGAMLIVLCAAACGPNEEEVAAAEQETGWVTIQEEHAALSGLRGELNATRAEIAAGPEGDEDTGLSPEEATLQLEQKAAEQEGTVNNAADVFNTNLVEFINENAAFRGEEVGGIQKAAISLKSGEDIELANEYVVKGGDYKRALDILQNAMLPDPENQALKDRHAELVALRYMNEERFSQIEKGMTESQVRATLGQVFHANVRDYKERDIIAWFYTREGGAAAAVYFQESRGQLLVYDMDFTAVKTAAERSE